jgi:hypothetical protein
VPAHQSHPAEGDEEAEVEGPQTVAGQAAGKSEDEGSDGAARVRVPADEQEQKKRGLLATLKEIKSGRSPLAPSTDEVRETLENIGATLAAHCVTLRARWWRV